jgi:hypothetical protein
MWLCESNVREVDLGFAVVVLALEETTGVILDPEVGSEAVVEVLGGGWAREIGRDLAFALGLDGGVGSSTAMLLSSSPSPASLPTFSFCLVVAARPTKLSPSASFSEPDASFNDLRGRFRAERDAKTEACDRTGEGLDLRAKDDPTLRDGEA